MWPFAKKKEQQAGQMLLGQPPANAQVTQAPSPGPTASTAVVPANKSRITTTNGAPQTIDVRAENIKSVIAPGEYFEGNMRFQMGVKVDGHIKGNVEFGITDGLLVVTDKGRIEGDIMGPRAIIVGEVFGDIFITGRLIVLPTARIHGDITADAVQLHEGASIDGRISTINDFRQQKAIEHQVSANESTPPQQSSVYPFVAAAANG